jgi:GNAT superfamily N-acetyltransferase
MAEPAGSPTSRSRAIVASVTLDIRPARRSDLPALIALLQQLSLDDPREDPAALSSYEAAFHDIESGGRQTVLVAEDYGVVVGTASFIVIPNLSHVGRPYAVVEDVVVDASRRSRGIGEALMLRTVELAKAAGCYKLVLTSNRRRTDAHRFYERLGFAPSHFGFRIDL